MNGQATQPAALRAGLEQSVIDVVKFKKDVTGLSEKDATVIRLRACAIARAQSEPRALGEDGGALRT